MTQVTTGSNVISGVFEKLEDAEAAIDEMKGLGLVADDFGLVIPEPEAHPGLKAEVTAMEELKGVAEGVAIAAPIGSLAGLGLMALAVPGAGVAAFAIVGGGVGALWGAFMGALGGFSARVRMSDEEDTWYEVPLESGDIMLVVHAREKAGEAHDVMHRHNVKCFVGECTESQIRR